MNGFVEKVTSLECVMKTVQEDISTLKGRTSEIEKTVKDMDEEVENLNCSVESNKCETKSLTGRLLYQDVYNRRENLRFIGIPETEEVTEENTSEIVM